MPKKEKSRENTRQNVDHSKKKHVSKDHHLKAEYSQKPIENAESFYTQGKKFAEQQSYSKAIEHYQAAIKALDEINERMPDDWRKIACYQSSLADVYLKQNNLQLSVFYFTQASAALEKLAGTLIEKDYQALSAYHFNIALYSTHQQKYQFKRVIDYQNKVSEPYRDFRMLLKCYFEIGNLEPMDESSTESTLNRKKDIYIQAIEHGKKIQNINNQDLRLIASCYNNLGNLFIFLDERDEALENFSAAIKFMGMISNKNEKDFQNISNTYYNLKRLFKGCDSYHLIFKFANNVFSNSKDANKEVKQNYFLIFKATYENNQGLINCLLQIMEIIRYSFEDKTLPNNKFNDFLKRSKDLKAFDSRISTLKQSLAACSSHEKDEDHKRLLQLLEKRITAVEAENKKLSDKNEKLEQTVRELQLQLDEKHRRKSDSGARKFEIDAKQAQEGPFSFFANRKKSIVNRTASSADIERIKSEIPIKS